MPISFVKYVYVNALLLRNINDQNKRSSFELLQFVENRFVQLISEYETR